MNIIDLIKYYDGKTVVDSVSFEIPKGKVLSLIGPNGAGKSTTMNIVTGYLSANTGKRENHPGIPVPGPKSSCADKKI